MDTKAFNERNFDKSRTVCEGIEREDGGGRVVLTDREREILDMWPRFEDGEPVLLGDETGSIVGQVIAIQLGAALVSFWNDSNDHVFIDYGERVKRTAPKALDADGVEIHVGDTVWANGNECGDGREWTVTRLDLSTGYAVVAQDRFGSVRDLKPRWLTHTRPDSWERLGADALKGVCEYAGAERKPGTIDAHTCCGCRFDEDGDGPTCEKQMALDLIRRAKALAGVEK